MLTQADKLVDSAAREYIALKEYLSLSDDVTNDDWDMIDGALEAAFRAGAEWHARLTAKEAKP